MIDYEFHWIEYLIGVIIGLLFGLSLGILARKIDYILIYTAIVNTINFILLIINERRK